MTAERTGSSDPKEITKFTAMAGEWWNPDGPMAPLHRLVPPRMRFIRDCLERYPDTASRRPLSGLSILDIGCGGGLLCEPLVRLGATVTGYDASAAAIAAAREHAERSGMTIDYRVGGSETVGREAGPFDAIIASEVIEHVPEPGTFVEELAGVLRPGGSLLLTTINRTVRSMLVAKIGAEYILRLLPVGTHDWTRFLTPAELDALLAAAGVEPVAHAGISYRMARDEFVLSDDLAINYAVHGVRTG